MNGFLLIPVKIASSPGGGAFIGGIILLALVMFCSKPTENANIRVETVQNSTSSSTPTSSVRQHSSTTTSNDFRSVPHSINFVGTWDGVDNNYTWFFNGSNYTLQRHNSDVERGTFSVNTEQTRFTQVATHTMRNGNWVPLRGTLISELTILSNNRFRMIGNNGRPYNETYQKR